MEDVSELHVTSAADLMRLFDQGIVISVLAVKVLLGYCYQCPCSNGDLCCSLTKVSLSVSLQLRYRYQCPCS